MEEIVLAECRVETAFVDVRIDSALRQANLRAKAAKFGTGLARMQSGFGRLNGDAQLRDLGFLIHVLTARLGCNIGVARARAVTDGTGNRRRRGVVTQRRRRGNARAGAAAWAVCATQRA